MSIMSDRAQVMHKAIALARFGLITLSFQGEPVIERFSAKASTGYSLR